MAKRTRIPKDVRRKKVSVTKNNASISFDENTSVIIIPEALNDLAGEGYSQSAGGYFSIIQDSEDLLNNLGFIPVEEEKLHKEDSHSVKYSKDFSLAKTLNEDTTIQNSKITDPDIDTLTPEPTSPVDKFKSTTDSFYDLDDEKPDNVINSERRARQRKNKKLIRLSTKLASISRVSNNKMLKRFPNRAKEIL